jgi:hypothetical protein
VTFKPKAPQNKKKNIQTSKFNMGNVSRQSTNHVCQVAQITVMTADVIPSCCTACTAMIRQKEVGHPCMGWQIQQSTHMARDAAKTCTTQSQTAVQHVHALAVVNHHKRST